MRRRCGRGFSGASGAGALAAGVGHEHHRAKHDACQAPLAVATSLRGRVEEGAPAGGVPSRRPSPIPPLSTEDIFRRIAGVLKSACIPHLLIGSVASSFHEALLAAQDIELVIAPTASQLRHLVGLLLWAEYYVSQEAALEALNRQRPEHPLRRQPGAPRCCGASGGRNVPWVRGGPEGTVEPVVKGADRIGRKGSRPKRLLIVTW